MALILCLVVMVWVTYSSTILSLIIFKISLLFVEIYAYRF